MSEYYRDLTSIKTIMLGSGQSIQEHLQDLSEPVVLQGLVAHWPAVKAALGSDSKLVDYLRQFDAQVPLQAFTAPDHANGRFFYNAELNGFNFTKIQTHLAEVLKQISAQSANAWSDKGANKQDSIYMGSTTLDYCLPGFAAENSLALDDLAPLVSIWLGNQSRVAAHYDLPHNIACVVAGRRRFILLPPEQVNNLYVGPLEFTPAGQPISLVDFEQPDFARFPRFKQALKHAQMAELEPGDALFIPSLWWHHVEGLQDLNVLVNYWWHHPVSQRALVTDVLHHAILAIRDLPAAQKTAVKALLDHYVFAPDIASVAEHIPPDSRGMLGEIDEPQARKIRADLLRRLNR